MEHNPLTPRQRKFAEAYLAELNATQAAVKAGYNAKTAYSQGQRLLKHTGILAYMETLRQEKVAAIEENRTNQIVFYQTVKERAMQAGNLSVALRAAQRLDKLMDYENLQGEWKKRQEESRKVNWANLTDEELIQFQMLHFKLQGWTAEELAKEKELNDLEAQLRADRDEEKEQPKPPAQSNEVPDFFETRR